MEIKEYLFQNDITVKEFASMLGISTSYMYQLLRGERKPSLDLACKIEKTTHGEITVNCWFSPEAAERKQSILEKLTMQDTLKKHEERISDIEGRFDAMEKRLGFLEKNSIEKPQRKSLFSQKTT